ncbi:RNA polymerase sigma-I factor [Salirhabdus salicampi]|uniref:RNA polymerase sigma-I factor n=1 Tax=Salirhabdus salicampi TaxID=476102 RepID=UPI0020C368AE|nr:RNA polymerase sigma-I factor [Salirhabdus salicampi]MCP8615317.1 RNA polymerase sigma-I factor [Salirhabdus salicampi]
MIERLLKRKKVSNDSLEEQVLAAQNGDQKMLHHLLDKYQPFIAKNVSEVCKKYIDPTKDDEFSIGLIAFHEAINAYNTDKGSSFLSFAKLVVKRKVIDYLRSENKKQVFTSIDEEYDDDEQLENPSEVKIAKERYNLETEAWNRREEINEYKEKLQEYQISFLDLTKIAPKHVDARDSAIKVARILYEHKELREQFLETKKLPMKELLPHLNISKKTVERNRKFIIAIFLILHEDYVFLKDYIKGVGL